MPNPNSIASNASLADTNEEVNIPVKIANAPRKVAVRVTMGAIIRAETMDGMIKKGKKRI